MLERFPSLDEQDLNMSIEVVFSSMTKDYEFSHLSHLAWASLGEKCLLGELLQISFFSWLVLMSAMDIPGVL